VKDFVFGKVMIGVCDLFVGDDYYIDIDFNVYELLMFFGNYDMGCIVMMFKGFGVLVDEVF